MPRRALLLLVLAACGDTPAAPDPAPPAPDAAPRPSPSPAPDARRWIAGDLHMHVSPLDDREGTTLTAAELAELAREAGLEFLVLTPHLQATTWRDPRRRAAWLARWRAMAQTAAPGVTLIPGAEYTARGFGHFGVWGVDLAALDGADPLAAASAAGGLVVVNHPFAVPTHIEGWPISEHDLSFHPWTDPRARPAIPRLDGVEVRNLPLALANLVSRPGGATGEARAFAAADRLARAERRHVAVVGGSDNHRALVVPTTWVLAADARASSVSAAVRAGATCVGGPEAGTLEARGDADAAWHRIGEDVHAVSRVELRWAGTARLFVDGADRGEHDGGFTDDAAGGVHTYRLEAGESRCGFVYANLP
jgi:hypothetical protein